MAASTKPGRKGRKRSSKGRRRSDAPRNYWRRDAPPLLLGQEAFRVRVIRPEKGDVIELDHEIVSISWEDASSILRGNIEVAKPETDRPLPFGEGHVFILDWRPGAGRWRELWRMRALAPNVQISGGLVDFELVDDLTFLSRSIGDFSYGVSKKHPKGVRGHKIIQAIARQFHFRLGRLAVMKHPIKKVHKTKTTPLDLVLYVLKLERNEIGTRLIPRMRRGRLEVLPLRRHRDMLVLGPAMIDASVKKSLRGGFATAFSARTALDGAKKGKKRKVRVRVKSSRGVKRYGYIERPLDVPKKLDSRREVRRYALKQLRKKSKPKEEVSFTHPGIPTVRRWDAVTVHIPEERIRKLCYVTSVTHTVSVGDYTMEVVCRFTDPFIDKRKDDTERKKCEKAKAHKRKLPEGCAKQGRPKRKQPKRAKRRGVSGGTPAP